MSPAFLLLLRSPSVTSPSLEAEMTACCSEWIEGMIAVILDVSAECDAVVFQPERVAEGDTLFLSTCCLGGSCHTDCFCELFL